jgi:hypothetical protein
VRQVRYADGRVQIPKRTVRRCARRARATLPEEKTGPKLRSHGLYGFRPYRNRNRVCIAAARLGSEGQRGAENRSRANELRAAAFACFAFPPLINRFRTRRARAGAAPARINCQGPGQIVVSPKPQVSRLAAPSESAQYGQIT